MKTEQVICKDCGNSWEIQLGNFPYVCPRCSSFYIREKDLIQARDLDESIYTIDHIPIENIKERFE